MEKIIIFDTETTGKKKTEDHDVQLIEAAWLNVNEDLTVLSEFNQRYKPSIPIDLGAMATHHIIEEDLVDCPPSSSFKLPETVEYIIGHNVDYDWEIIGKPNVKRICTLALARKLLPDLDSHSQVSLMYHFSEDKNEAREMVKNAHNALTDVKNCQFVLNSLINVFKLQYGKEVKDIEYLWKMSERARIPDVISFGKHKGDKIKDLPKDYIIWLKKQNDLDPYLRVALDATEKANKEQKNSQPKF